MVDFKAISRDIIKKWIGIPYALMLIISASSVENIPDRWYDLFYSKWLDNDFWITNVLIAGCL